MNETTKVHNNNKSFSVYDVICYQSVSLLHHKLLPSLCIIHFDGGIGVEHETALLPRPVEIEGDAKLIRLAAAEGGAFHLGAHFCDQLRAFSSVSELHVRQSNRNGDRLEASDSSSGARQ